MRNHQFVDKSYYHIYNRGVDKRDVFSDEKDIKRFLLCMNLFNFKTPVGSVQLMSRENSSVDVKRLQKVFGSEKLVSIVSYCLNPNHFHFILKQEAEGGISEFMKRLQGGYTKYFNEKHARSGSLFQGTFKSVHIDRDEYFKLILAYVTWNYKVHSIPKNKERLIRSSELEYQTKKFFIIEKTEAELVLDIFNGFKNFSKISNEVVDIIKQNRIESKNFDFNEN